MLTMQEVKASVAMALTQVSRNILISAQVGFLQNISLHTLEPRKALIILIL